jgi:hypothetical protein
MRTCPTTRAMRVPSLRSCAGATSARTNDRNAVSRKPRLKNSARASAPSTRLACQRRDHGNTRWRGSVANACSTWVRCASSNSCDTPAVGTRPASSRADRMRCDRAGSASATTSAMRAPRYCRSGTRLAAKPSAPANAAAHQTTAALLRVRIGSARVDAIKTAVAAAPAARHTPRKAWIDHSRSESWRA